MSASAPGRVNLIGEHTDYTGGLALPMAVDLVTTVEGRRIGSGIVLGSDAASGTAEVAIDGGFDAAAPAWAAYVAAVAAGLAERGQSGGFEGVVRSTLPVGAGLSSSAALAVAVALALGFDGSRRELAVLARAAEERAVGVPCGLLDQLASVCGTEGHALLINFADLSVSPVPLPDGLEVVVVHSGETRTLAGSAYAERRRQCEAAAAVTGPLRHAAAGDLERIDDDVLRRRARHVVSENDRVLAMVDALETGDLTTAGALLTDGHRSLRHDFEVSTPTIDALVERLVAIPGVFGARLTGGGFGGCVVAFSEPGVLACGPGVWPVRATGGASVELRDDRAAPPSSPRTPPG